MFRAPSGLRSTVAATPSNTTFRTTTRRESKGQKATLTDTRSAIRSIGLPHPGLFRTTTFSTPTPRPERI